MSTRSSTRNLFPPLDNPELTIQRRSRSDPTLLNNSEMAAKGPTDQPVPDLRTMKELCQPSLNGWGGPIAPITIQAMHFGLKNDMIQQKAKMFLGKYFPPSMVTKLRNEITNSRQRPDESLFEAWERYKLSIDRCPNHNMLPVTHIDTFYNGLTLRHRDTINAAAGGTFMKRRPEECNDLIENINAHHKDWDTSAQQKINKNLMRVLQPPLVILKTFMLQEPIKANNAILKNMQTNMTYLTNSNIKLKNMFGQFMKMNTASSSGLETLLGNTITNPKEDLKGITTRRGIAYPGPTIPTYSSSPLVERETEATKDTVHPTNNGSIEDVQPLVFQTESPILNSEPVISPIIDPVSSPVSAPRPNQRPSIPYPSRLQDQKLHDKTNDQPEKNFQIFKDLNFNISFADALILMPKFGPSIKSLLTNKDKLCELARTPLNEHCSAVLLKKLLEKLGDPDKFLISCDFPEMAKCLALADLDASVNLMPLSVFGVAEDVFVKVGTFHFPTDFIVVDFDANPRVPLILKRSFLKTKRALIDVLEGRLTLCVGKEAITFNLYLTSRYSVNYNDMTEKRIDVIDMACEDYSQEVLGFFDMIASGNPTPYYDPIVSTTSLTLTLFGNSDF
uniref:Reverse transcriptase domain-containing protein n=1 Tax=Tanacetum cinerariifolium TaxID=118510 RepID=A0A6L2P2N7_TANCI|nr:reverse transcriptase domain-containing protein [Tanacetum cinerariifolium]